MRTLGLKCLEGMEQFLIPLLSFNRSLSRGLNAMTDDVMRPTDLDRCFLFRKRLWYNISIKKAQKLKA
jgi:hypothetical protein